MTVFVLCTLACQEELESISQVTKFRVMAVQADPPEIYPGQWTHFRVLFADPKGGGREVTVVWAVLAGLFVPSSDLSGILDGQDTDGGFDTDGEDGSDVLNPLLWACPGTTASQGGDQCAVPTFEEDILPRIPPGEDRLTATAIVLLCAGGGLPDFEEIEEQGLGKISSLKELCRNADGTPGDGLVALKTVKIVRPDAPDAGLNTNPTVEEVFFSGDRIVPQVTDEGEKLYGVYDCKGADGCREAVPIEVHLSSVGEERHYVSWFTTGGKFPAGDRSGTADEAQLGPYKTEWLPPRQGGNFTQWVVAHDVLGGVSWKRIDVYEPIIIRP